MVHIVAPPMGLLTPSAPWVFSLVPPLGTLCSAHWLSVSICLCIYQALAEPLRRQLYQVPVSKHLLASTILSGFDGCLWDGSPGRAVSGWSFLSLCSTLCLCNSFHLNFVLPSKKDQSIHTFIYLFLKSHVFCKLYLGYYKLLG